SWNTDPARRLREGRARARLRRPGRKAIRRPACRRAAVSPEPPPLDRQAGRRAQALPRAGGGGDRRRAGREQARPAAAAPEGGYADDHADELRAGDRDPAGFQPAQSLSRNAAVARLSGRDRPGELSDAARSLPGRRQVAEPVVVPTQLTLGTGVEAGAAGAWQPARDPLDGPERAGRRDPRHARRGLDRLLRLARLHQDADSGRRMALPARP